MTDYSERFQANAEQAEYWNEGGGLKWVEFQQTMDSRFGAMTNELLRRAAPGPGERVLDIGCGTGATTVRLADAVGPKGRVTAIDISEPMLALARERCRELLHVSFEIADAQVSPFAERDYDLHVSRFGVMFFGDPYAAFRNLARSLRDNGRLHFVCWAPLDRNPWFTIPLEVAKHHLGSPDPVPPRSPGPLAFSEPHYVEDILRQAGLGDIRIDLFETAIAGDETPAQHAELFLKLGPAARLIAERKPAADTLEALAADLTRELGQYASGTGVSLKAAVYFVSASK